MRDWITSRGVTFRRPIADEKTEQASIRNLITMIGGEPLTLGTARAVCCGVCGSPSTDPSTRQSEGLADLAVFLPPSPRAPTAGRVFVWIECKGRRGTLSDAQVHFRALCLAAGLNHVVGGLDAVIEFLFEGGWVKSRPVGEEAEVRR